MSTFDIDRKYSENEVAILAPQLFNVLKKDFVWGPGAWGTNPRVRAAATILFEEGEIFGGYLNAAAE
ncbi:MAG: hypothetical protein M0R28_20340 [Pigmentiphaga sp.]|nr:hypothetical protein [Pigmentiphaga sp.]